MVDAADDKSARSERGSSRSSAFSARLDAALRALGIDNAQFARAIDPESGSQKVNNWRRRGGIGAPSFAQVRRALPGISLEWLNEGIGDGPFVAGQSTDVSTETTRSVPSTPSGSETTRQYVRFLQFDGAGGMGDGAINADYPEVVREVDIAEWEVRRKLGFVPPPGRVRLLTGRGPSMRGMIEHGDVVLVDTAVTYFDGDAVYVLNIGGETQIKILQLRPDGLYVVSKNADYPEYKVNAEAGDFHIGGKVLCTLGVRPI